MTKGELELLQMKARQEVLFQLLSSLYVGLAGLSPNAPTILRGKFAEMKAVAATVVLKGLTAEYSDLITAEYQTVLEEYIGLIDERLPEASS